MGTPEELRTVLGHVDAGRLKPVIDSVCRLDEIRKAHERLADRAVFAEGRRRPVTEELHENPEFPVELPYRRVLDKGFVALADVMGSDASIVQAARVSYGKGMKTVRSDKKQ